MLNGWPWYFCKMLGIIPMLFLPHIVRDHWALKIIKMRFDKLLFELNSGCRGLNWLTWYAMMLLDCRVTLRRLSYQHQIT